MLSEVSSSGPFCALLEDMGANVEVDEAGDDMDGWLEESVLEISVLEDGRCAVLAMLIALVADEDGDAVFESLVILMSLAEDVRGAVASVVVSADAPGPW